MHTKILSIIPVLPSADIANDVAWYSDKLGLKVYSEKKMFAMLYRDTLCIHLQWHADTASDPQLGGSVSGFM
jgi:hypothetical protein